MSAFAGRHHSVARLAPAFEALDDLPDEVHAALTNTAVGMLAHLPDCPELTRALNQLLQSVDLFRRGLTLERARLGLPNGTEHLLDGVE